VTAALLVALAATGVATSRWGALRAPLGLPPAAAPALASPTPLSWSKDYVYAGGRLVATEEPSSAYPRSGCCVDKGGNRITSCRCYNDKLPKPQSLLATARPDALVPEVAVSWPSAGGGLRYELERGTSVNRPFTLVSPADTPTSVTDSNNVGACTAYLYRVRSVDEYGDYSDYSNVDLATTCVFSQDPLVPRGTVIRAAHLEELRAAIEAVRRAALPSQPPPSWTDPALQGKRIRAVHVEELRSRLDEALGSLGLTAQPPYTDAGSLLGVEVKAAHVQELRERVR
jgi:hypothetical protein